MVSSLKNILAFSKIQEKMRFMNMFRPFQHKISQPGSVDTALHEVMKLAVNNLPLGDIEVGQEAIMVGYDGHQNLDDQDVIPIPPAPCGPAILHLTCTDHMVTDLTSRYSNSPTGLPLSVSVHNASAVETACMCCTEPTVSILSDHHALAAKTAYAYHVHGRHI